MDHNNEHIEKPQSDAYVELSAVGQNQLQKGIIFSEVNSLRQECEVSYEPNEDILAPGIYSFDLFYEPNITAGDAEPNKKNTGNKSTERLVLKLKK